MNRETKGCLLSVGALGVVLFGAIWVRAVLFAYFEAEAFNRHTGQNVSTWDAMFLELRIQDDGKGQIRE